MSSSNSGKDRKKYDRQLRIWDDHGQDAIEEARVLLLNATATGSEILKNLVLPGLGSFHIIDNKEVTHDDLGNNFFVTKSDLGKSRAETVTNLLLEMNPDVAGAFSQEDPEEVIAGETSLLEGYSVIVACNLQPAHFLTLARWGEANDTPVVLAQANGLVGRIRLFCGEHTVVESKPDDYHPDLRLRDSFPAFDEYVASYGDIDSLEAEPHREVPYAVLLKYLMDQYVSENGGKYPQSSAEKDAFKAFIRNKSKNMFDEDNFAEAVKKAFLAWMPYEIPSEVKAILEDDKVGKVDADTPVFWVLVSAIKQFVDNEGEGKLPLNGSIPDMFASTDNYVSLQKLYNAKAAEDIAAVQAYADALCEAAGRPKVERVVTKRYCKNSAFMQLLRYKPLEQEYAAEEFDVEGFNMQVMMAEFMGKNVFWYAAYRALDAYVQSKGKVADASDEGRAGMVAMLKEWLGSVGADQESVPEDYAVEMARYQGVELHNMAAMLGGVGAQEILKIVTHQFVPFNHTLIINGVEGSSSTFNF